MPLVRGGTVLPVVHSVTTWYDCTRDIIRTGWLLRGGVHR